jgi:lysophospholipid acyltransferase (LPLAT)-like uncharacterized protein
MKIRLNPTLASFLASLFIRILGVTWRLEFRGEEHVEEARRRTGRVIYAFFHGRLLALSWSHRNRKVHVLASEHYDGDLMGRTIEWLGFGHLKGSTSRGGAKAIRELRRILSEGYDIGLTVDGPRGPRGKIQQGATELSRLAGAAVVPVTNTARRRKIFWKSWDRFQIPAPFAKVIVEFGEPLSVPDGADAQERETLRITLEKRLGDLTAALDRDIGYAGVEIWPHEDN